MSAASKEAIHAALASARWQFAKTMARIPHEWTRRNRWVDGDLFTAAVALINGEGRAQRFGGKVFRYYEPGDGFKYWAGDLLPAEEFLINRAKV